MALLELSDGSKIPNPTDGEIALALGKLLLPGSFAIMTRTSNLMTYVQARPVAAHEYILEFQDARLDQHYRAAGTVPITQVMSVFRRYQERDNSWLNDFTWLKVELTAGSHSAAGSLDARSK